MDFSKTPSFVSMGKSDFREKWPEWIRQLPILGMKYDENFQLIPPDQLEEMLAQTSPEVAERIREDLEVLERELLWIFRERDFSAKQQQNRYRQFQIRFMLLAALATAIGSFQVVALSQNTQWIPWIAFAETIVALMTTFYATLRGNKPPLQEWIMNRRRGEYLRREYFRFLADAPPYDKLDGATRRRTLARRAADINRGVDPADIH